MQALHGSRFPMGKELGLEIVLAAKLRLVGGAAEKFEDELGLELRRKDSSLTTRHWRSPGRVQYLSCYWSSARGAPQASNLSASNGKRATTMPLFSRR